MAEHVKYLTRLLPMLQGTMVAPSGPSLQVLIELVFWRHSTICKIAHQDVVFCSLKPFITNDPAYNVLRYAYKHLYTECYSPKQRRYEWALNSFIKNALQSVQRLRLGRVWMKWSNLFKPFVPAQGI